MGALINQNLSEQVNGRSFDVHTTKRKPTARFDHRLSANNQWSISFR